jgi:hypothetical protein
MRFLGIARGSVRELECQMLLSRDLGYMPEDVWATLDVDTDEISRMLNGLIRSFQSGHTYRMAHPSHRSIPIEDLGRDS